MLRCIEIRVGLRGSGSEEALGAFLAFPKTWICPSVLKMFSSTLHMKAESSTTSMRIFLLVVDMVRGLRHGGDRAWCLRSHELFDRGDQLLFLHWLGQERCGAFLHRAVAVLCAGAGGYDHHRDTSGRGTLPQLHHQFIAGHPRHLQVGNHKMTAVLRNEFHGVEAVGR